MISRGGVFYDLKESWFCCPLDGIMYYFSSKNHLEKFLEQAAPNRDRVNGYLSKRYGMQIELNNLADLMLYKQVETRGFYIMKGGETIECPAQVKLNGEMLIL